MLWAAGVQANKLTETLADQSGAERDRSGRIKVGPDVTLPGHPEVFVIGDMMTLNGYPGVAQVAMQQGAYAATQIMRRLQGKADQKPFKYFNKGDMATISRFKAVASIGPLRFGGFIAWVLWLFIHVFYLVGFKNRVTTVLHWAVSFLGRGRAQRTTTHRAGDRAQPGRGGKRPGPLAAARARGRTGASRTIRAEQRRLRTANSLRSG